jgi:hypothetical protein
MEDHGGPGKWLIPFPNLAVDDGDYLLLGLEGRVEAGLGQQDKGGERADPEQGRNGNSHFRE